MVNFLKARIVPFLGIIAIAAVIGFSMTACSDDDDGGPDFSGTWKKTADDGTQYTVTIKGKDITIKDDKDHEFTGTLDLDGATQNSTSGYYNVDIVGADTGRLIINGDITTLEVFGFKSGTWTFSCSGFTKS